MTSLYTNIDHLTSLGAATKTLNQSKPGPGLRPSNTSFIHVLKLVLTLNNFQFNCQNYLQIFGMAMGTWVAPSFAIHTMGAFESKYIYPYHLKPLVYLHYIDDIFIIWQHRLDSLLTFIEHLNTCSLKLKFTSEVSRDKVTFLDTWTKLHFYYRVINSLITELFSKPTDSHTYLVYNSALGY